MERYSIISHSFYSYHIHIFHHIISLFVLLSRPYSPTTVMPPLAVSFCPSLHTIKATPTSFCQTCNDTEKSKLISEMYVSVPNMQALAEAQMSLFNFAQAEWRKKSWFLHFECLPELFTVITFGCAPAVLTSMKVWMWESRHGLYITTSTLEINLGFFFLKLLLKIKCFFYLFEIL